MHSKITLLLGASLLATSIDASANFQCTGSVNYLGMQGNGTVFVSLNDGNHIHAICNVNDQGVFGVTVAACKSMYGTLLLAKTTNRGVGIYYGDNSFNCAAIPNWGSMPSTYFAEIY